LRLLHRWVYKIDINQSTISVIAETNPTELKEFIIAYLSYTGFFGVLIGLCGFAFFIYKIIKFEEKSFIKKAKIASIALIISIISFYFVKEERARAAGPFFQYYTSVKAYKKYIHEVQTVLLKRREISEMPAVTHEEKGKEIYGVRDIFGER
jgi:glucan phosphoethanolaminetransferase (alkaline phosphatase superfamily)